MDSACWNGCPYHGAGQTNALRIRPLIVIDRLTPEADGNCHRRNSRESTIELTSAKPISDTNPCPYGSRDEQDTEKQAHPYRNLSMRATLAASADFNRASMTSLSLTE